ncbi:MAG: D-alanine--D-alanine ligase [Flavobacteriaceae bacterium]|jgi:D-alanine-D-alanine ligase|nr:D-alanine--D-alanine ligase [Flavobacteriaceae bacterium]
MTAAIVMGGYSGEYEVSLKSGEYLYSQIDKSNYEVYKVHILKDGWNVIAGEKKYPIDREDFSFTLDGRKITFDVVVNIIHGTPGENGLLQAYWQLFGIPYTGCSFYNSALTFNKKDTLQIMGRYGISIADSVSLSQNEKIDEAAIIQKLGLPCFVKPNQSGSSLGVSKVKTKEELKPAIEKAFLEDDFVLVESFLQGREFSVGVMKYEGETLAVGITEIISENEFFDYEAKYLGKSTEVTPAQIDENEERELKETAKSIYNLLNMTGFARIDFILVGKTAYFLEINTNPGCSPASIFPQQAKYAGFDFSKILDNEIELALHRI